MELNSLIKRIVNNRKLQHVFFWIFILAFFTYPNTFNNDVIEVLTNNLLYLGIDITVTYITLYLFIPKFLLNRKLGKFLIYTFLLIITTVTVTWFIMIYIEPLLFKNPTRSSLATHVFNSTLILTMIIGLAASIKLMKYGYDLQFLKTELENKNMKSELALLRAQINPHFLFNILNNIDTLVYKDQDKASESIIKLADIMRYMLSHANSESVKLEEELNFIKSFIELARQRFRENTFINYTEKINSNGISIPPLLFIPFIENAIKYSEKNVTAPGIIINIFTEKNFLFFNIKNTIKKIDFNKKNYSFGIGLQNVKRRLEMLYPNEHSLEISNSNNEFNVNLKIRIK
ncbi:sensor histidine kinase [Bacteroidota bacterium]